MSDTIEVRGFDEMMRKLPRFRTRPVLAAGAGEYKAQWRAHFRTLDAKGNAHGWPSRHFWIDEGFKKTDITELTDERARVACDSAAVSFQANGGTIRPRTAGGIAVPVSAAAYAAGWPSNSGLPLEFIPLRSKKNPHFVGVLQEARATRISYTRKGGVKSRGENTATAGITHYLIFDEITKRVGMGDAVKPSETDAHAAVYAKMADAVQRQIDKAGESGK